jgi:hypothetical protein
VTSRPLSRWIRVWDEGKDRWTNLWVILDEDVSIRVGTATTLSPDKSAILGPNGKPIRKPSRLGFRPPNEVR